MNQLYRDQVSLLIKTINLVAKEECFALKGGTAINLFFFDMPRLSVDIDLTYTPFDDRDTAFANILEALSRIKKDIEKSIPSAKASLNNMGRGMDSKLIIKNNKTTIKIEVNTIMRGHIFPTKLMPICGAAQDEFGEFAAIKVMSKKEVLGGKICAALDRQHPRDLFDIHYLLQNDGIDENIKQGFLIALLSGNRPINEMINPNKIDQQTTFKEQFEGMTLRPFSYQDYDQTRGILIKTIQDVLTKEDKKFLTSFKQCEPKWNLAPAEKIQELPAVRWKLMNIKKLLKSDPKKHEEQLEALKKALK